MTKFNPNNRFKNMTVAQKLKVAEMLYWSARDLKKASLRSIHPDWPEKKVEQVAKESFMYARS